jgi:hypothetical protein
MRTKANDRRTLIAGGRQAGGATAEHNRKAAIANGKVRTRTGRRIAAPRLTRKEKTVARQDGLIDAIKLLRARTDIGLRSAAELVRAYLQTAPRSTMADVKRAKAAFDAHRDNQEALGFEVCMVVVGYVSGRDPFRLLGRVAADTGMTALPDPPLTMAEMQPVAFAAKMALAKVLVARRKAGR